MPVDFVCVSPSEFKVRERALSAWGALQCLALGNPQENAENGFSPQWPPTRDTDIYTKLNININ